MKPDWKEAAIYSVKPILMFDTGYITMLIAMVGTSIAPWMQFYLQSAIVEKGHHGQGIRAVARGSDRGLHFDGRGGVLHHRGVRGAPFGRTGRRTSTTPPMPRWR